MVRLAIVLLFVCCAMLPAFGPVIYVGSFTGNLISIFQLDSEGNLTPKGSVDAGYTPTWLDIRGGVLFTTDEQSGNIANFKINIEDGSLSFISRQNSSGGSPTHLSIDRNGKFVLAANYDTGSVVVLPVLQDGTIGPKVSFSQHTGKGPDPDRQTGPHAHEIVLDRTERFAFSPDLGVDKVYQYVFDPLTGQLVPNTVPFVATNPGDGPRHITFHPSGRFAYLACELSSMIIAFKFDQISGTLATIQRLSTLPTPQANNYPAEVVVLPNGRYAYVSNRGNDSIAVFQISEESGTLTLIQTVPVGGAYPRGLILDETLRILYAMNQNSGSVTALVVDYETGMLKYKGVSVNNLVTPVTATILRV